MASLIFGQRNGFSSHNFNVNLIFLKIFMINNNNNKYDNESWTDGESGDSVSAAQRIIPLAVIH